MSERTRLATNHIAPPTTWTLLANSRRRGTLAVLDNCEQIAIDHLAAAVAAATGDAGDDAAADGVSEEARDRVHASLVHSHLPKLAAAGALRFDTDAGTVCRRDHDVYGSSLLREDLDAAVCSALGNERRQTVVSVLGEFAGPVNVDDLAAHVAAAETDASLVAVDAGTHDSVMTSLHHAHLPKLDAAGLVSHDVAAGTAALADDLPAPVAELAGRERSPTVAGEPVGNDARTIQGRDAVVARGQDLFDRADDELFLMLTTEGLLEPDCLTGLADAVDRGVDVYLGSQTRAVRDLVREALPAVTIWEPQLDWLSLPPNRERLGRLVMCDREAVLLGTLGEAGPADDPRETAVTAAGEDNTLVVLLRELLGSRPDHLDRQSDDFRSKLQL